MSPSPPTVLPAHPHLTDMLLLACLAVGAPWLMAQAELADEPAAPHRYTNSNYLFSIVEPPGLPCETDPPPHPNHGCRIAIDSSSQASLSVLGEFNALDRANAGAELDARAGWLLRPGASVKVLRREETLLDGLKAERLTLRTEEPGRASARVRDWVAALRSVPRWGDIVYRVELDTTEDRYLHDVTIFEAVLASWRAEAPEPGPGSK